MTSMLAAGEVLAPSGPVRLRAPRAELAGVLSTLWLTEVAGDAGLTRVLPDAQVDLVFGAGRLRVAGPDTGPVCERLPGGAVLGFQLRAGAVETVLGVPASELVNQRVELAELWGRDGRVVAMRMAEAPSALAAAGVLETALAARVDAASLDRVPGRVRALVARGWSDVRALAAEVGLGERQLRRRATAAFGYGPRTLARIVRFQRVLAALRSPAAPGLAELAVREGYADQAHLSREVAALAGLTPGALRAALGAAAGPP
jgi:AraC-like DNA-binding protein